MKNKVWGILLFIIIFIIGIMILYLTISSNYFGSIKGNITKMGTVDSMVIDFMAEEKDIIFIKHASYVKKGTLEFELVHETGNIIEHFTSKAPKEIEVIIEESGIYSFKVRYENFIGKYSFELTK